MLAVVYGDNELFLSSDFTCKAQTRSRENLAIYWVNATKYPGILTQEGLQ